MKEMILGVIGIAICFFFVPAQVVYGQAEKVDPEIKQVYEYYLGQSLEDAIDSISANNRSPQSAVGDTALVNPNAPKVHSSGSRRICYAPFNSPSKASVPDEPIHTLSVQQLRDHRSVRLLDNGERIFDVLIKYDGDISDLVPLGLKLRRPLSRLKGAILVEFPISLLPTIARHVNIRVVTQARVLELR